MNIVNSGTTFQIYDESVKTYQHLPVGCYQINFNPMSGFSLGLHNNLKVLEDKIYGDTEVKVDKILKSFKLTDRNFGVILSGAKGVGKSLFARVLAKKANEMGISLILATRSYPGLEDFISSIEEEVIVLFDEFEKNFNGNYDSEYDDELGSEGGSQNNLLSLFDGIDNGKKLFIITCNETYKLSKYFINRPGRFHYHFRINPPTSDEISEYLNDKLKDEYKSVIPTVISFSALGSMTYDCLRALVFDLNQGYSLEDTLECLNITRDKNIQLNITVKLDNGKTLTCNEWVDVCDENRRLYFRGENGEEMGLDIDGHDIKYSSEGFTINPACVSVRYYNEERDRLAYAETGSSNLPTVVSIKVEKVDEGFVYRYMV